MKTENKKLMVNIFESRKAMLKFSELSNKIGASSTKEGAEIMKADFTAKVIALFEKKTISEEGEYSEFKITEKDLIRFYNEAFAVRY